MKQKQARCSFAIRKWVLLLLVFPWEAPFAQQNSAPEVVQRKLEEETAHRMFITPFSRELIMFQFPASKNENQKNEISGTKLVDFPFAPENCVYVSSVEKPAPTKPQMFQIADCDENKSNFQVVCEGIVSCSADNYPNTFFHVKCLVKNQTTCSIPKDCILNSYFDSIGNSVKDFDAFRPRSQPNNQFYQKGVEKKGAD